MVNDPGPNLKFPDTYENLASALVPDPNIPGSDLNPNFLIWSDLSQSNNNPFDPDILNKEQWTNGYLLGDLEYINNKEQIIN